MIYPSAAAAIVLHVAITTFAGPAASAEALEGPIPSSPMPLPRSVLASIEARIAKQTSFAQLTSNGIVRWSARAVTLIELVAVPSPSFPDTDVFAMRYSVSVLSDDLPLAVDETTCQVLLIRKDGEFADPTVVCEPVNVSPAQAS
jgi:hypothetical protein